MRFGGTYNSVLFALCPAVKTRRFAARVATVSESKTN